MPLAAPIAASLNAGLTAKGKALWIDGLDVISMGSGVTVRPSDVSLTWAGPGQVSALTFVLNDPNGVLAPTRMQRVVLMNLVTGQPLFQGWITDVRYQLRGLGRKYTIMCSGLEIILDWMVVPARSYAGGATIGLHSIIADLFVNATQVPYPVNLNLASIATSGTTGSTVAGPIAGGFGSFAPNTAFTTPGGSLRRAIEYAVGFVLADLSQDFQTLKTLTTVVTIDRWGGLRVYTSPIVTTSSFGIEFNGADATHTGDHAQLVANTGGSVGQRPSDPEVGYTGSDVARSVLVKNATVTTIVSDGSGIPGRGASINDQSSGTAAAQAAGWAFLLRQQELLTGRLRLDTVPGAGSGTAITDSLSRLTVTDSVLGISAVDTQIAHIRIAFANSGEETWDIEFGVASARGTSYMRSLTADQLS